ncbi:hypothetical protein AB833_29885 [Chromatiales bacterium (ex Bugula neritina AB1)]|nr:hypothetical protein AB833_29885 [Chromatiales bacterium (ex Bugula neritina AB1)]
MITGNRFRAVFFRTEIIAFVLFVISVSPVSALTNSSEWPVTDFKNTSIDVSEILSGGPPKDGIPSIDSPKFISTAEASEWLAFNEPVISLDVGGEAKAYPLQILTWHEIVNDVIDDLPVTVTFCPLCNASIVFNRTIEDVVYDFGTTGRLRRSDMVMYDRQTESWWQQFTGVGIIGKMNGVKLAQIPSSIVSFESFKMQYPNGTVLSRETGYTRQYGSNPYPGYDNINSSPFLFRGVTDKRLPPMERVLSLRSGDKTLLFGLSALADQTVLNTRFDNRSVAVFSFATAASALDKRKISDSRAIPTTAIYDAVHNSRKLTFILKDGVAVDEQTESSWNVLGYATAGPLAGERLTQLDSGVHFAFAWLAFDPEAEIYQP